MRASAPMIVALVIALTGSAVAQPRTGPHVHRPVSYTEPSPYQFAFEAGAALPYGDLGDDFEGTRKGLGAGTGYELGARLRYYATGTLTVGPSFHYADFGDWEGLYDDEFGVDAYATGASVLRFGLDIQQFLAPVGHQLRPYITLGAALCNNRYEDWVEGGGTFRTNSTNLAVGAGLGLALGPIELSAVWNYNPAKNRNLPRASGVNDTSYDWSYLVVRAGLSWGVY